MKALSGCLAVVVALAFSGASNAERAAAPLANGRIAFVTAGGLASMNPDGSGVWGLVPRVYDATPAWSPDGSRLALALYDSGTEGITVVDPDGRTNRLRLTFTLGDREPAWSPDDARLAYRSGDGGIAVVPAAGGPSTRLTTGSADGQPAWSPDGRTVAFTRQTDDGPQLWTVDVASRAETMVVDGGSAPSWSPRGELTYLVDRIAYLRTSDGAAAKLLGDVNWQSPVVWSPDGARLLFARNGAVWLADAAGKELGPLAAGWEPSWQSLVPRTDSCTLWGTPGADLLVGSPGDDVICGLGDDDTLLGMNGSDLLAGGAGNDWIAGGQGYDRLFGDAGDDRLDARDGGGDVVVGGPGLDAGLLERADGALGVERRGSGGDLAAWRPVQSSGGLLTDPPERAVDGRADDAWNPGGWPPQWLEIDLQQPTVVGRIRLIAGSQGAAVNHLVLGRGPATHGAYRLLATVKGPTADGQEVVVKPKRPWRGIRRLRIQSMVVNFQGLTEPVSWHEIEVYAPPR